MRRAGVSENFVMIKIRDECDKILALINPSYGDMATMDDVKNAHGFIFVFSLSSRPSFDALNMCRGYIQR